MGEDYKKKLYSKYVSTLNVHLYSGTAEESARKLTPSFEKYYAGFLPEAKSAHLLDLGCGDGTLLHWLERRGFSNAEGVDVSPEQIEVAKQLGIKRVSCEDLRVFLSKSNIKYDVIFLRDVLGHFSKMDIMDILSLACKSLKDGGWAIIKTPNAESPFSGQLRYGDFTHDVSFTRTSLQQVASAAGFKRVEVYPTPPVVHGVKSALRFALWQIIELCLRFYRLVDAGSREGIFTQNVIAAAYK